MKTATELAVTIGMTADYNKIDGIVFTVNIIDTRERFGNLDCLIIPVAGSGGVWVSAYSLRNIR